MKGGLTSSSSSNLVMAHKDNIDVGNHNANIKAGEVKYNRTSVSPKLKDARIDNQPNFLTSRPSMNHDANSIIPVLSNLNQANVIFYINIFRINY